MDQRNNTVTLYSPQAEAVWDAVITGGAAYSRREYIRRKYEDCAEIFLTAYDAYIREAEKIVPRPDDKAYPYWAFASLDSLDRSGNARIMKMEVPISEAVFFDQYDWFKVLRLSYIGDTPEEETAFVRKLEMRGIRDSSAAVLKPFYPDIKREIIQSWKKLFRNDNAIRRGDTSGVRAVQAGLWVIRKEWLID